MGSCQQPGSWWHSCHRAQRLDHQQWRDRSHPPRFRTSSVHATTKSVTRVAFTIAYHLACADAGAFARAIANAFAGRASISTQVFDILQSANSVGGATSSTSSRSPGAAANAISGLELR